MPPGRPGARSRGADRTSSGPTLRLYSRARHLYRSADTRSCRRMNLCLATKIYPDVRNRLASRSSLCSAIRTAQDVPGPGGLARQICLGNVRIHVVRTLRRAPLAPRGNRLVIRPMKRRSTAAEVAPAVRGGWNARVGEAKATLLDVHARALPFLPSAHRRLSARAGRGKRVGPVAAPTEWVGWFVCGCLANLEVQVVCCSSCVSDRADLRSLRDLGTLAHQPALQVTIERPVSITVIDDYGLAETRHAQETAVCDGALRSREHRRSFCRGVVNAGVSIVAIWTAPWVGRVLAAVCVPVARVRNHVTIFALRVPGTLVIYPGSDPGGAVKRHPVRHRRLRTCAANRPCYYRQEIHKRDFCGCQCSRGSHRTSTPAPVIVSDTARE